MVAECERPSDRPCSPSRADVAKTTGTTTTTYLNDPQNPTGYTKAVEEHADTTGDGTAEAHRSYVLGLQVIAQSSGAELYYLVVDGHGSTRMLLEGSGQAVVRAGQAQVYSGACPDRSGMPMASCWTAARFP